MAFAALLVPVQSGEGLEVVKYITLAIRKKAYTVRISGPPYSGMAWSLIGCDSTCQPASTKLSFMAPLHSCRVDLVSPARTRASLPVLIALTQRSSDPSSFIKD